MAKRKMKCKLVRLCPDEVIVKKAHLREDIHEARVGIQRDERALGSISPDTGTRVQTLDQHGRVIRESWFLATAWDNPRLGWPDVGQTAIVSLIQNGAIVASREVEHGDAPTSMEQNRAGLPATEWNYPPYTMRSGRPPDVASLRRLNRRIAILPAAPGVNGLGYPGLEGLGNIVRTSYTVHNRLSFNIYGEPVSTYDIVDHRGHVVEADFHNYWDAYNRANHLTAVNRELLRMGPVEAQIAEKRRARAREASTTELWDLDF